MRAQRPPEAPTRPSWRPLCGGRTCCRGRLSGARTARKWRGESFASVGADGRGSWAGGQADNPKPQSSDNPSQNSGEVPSRQLAPGSVQIAALG